MIRLWRHLTLTLGAISVKFENDGSTQFLLPRTHRLTAIRFTVRSNWEFCQLSHDRIVTDGDRLM